MNCNVVIKVSGVGYSGHGQVFLDDQPANDYTDAGLTNLVKVWCYLFFSIFSISCCLFPSLIATNAKFWSYFSLTLQIVTLYIASVCMLFGAYFETS